MKKKRFSFIKIIVKINLLKINLQNAKNKFFNFFNLLFLGVRRNSPVHQPQLRPLFLIVSLLFNYYFIIFNCFINYYYFR